MLSEIYKIKNLLIVARDTFDSLPLEVQEQFNNLHNECYQLAHCLRWGAVASEEVLEDLDQFLIDGKTLKVGKNQIYYDKMCGEYVVEEFEYLDEYKGTKEPMYSVLDGFETLDEAYQAAKYPSRFKHTSL